MALGLAFVVIFVSCTASLASAQRLKPDPTCVCDPLCQIYPDELNPNSCGLQIPRSDCPCCRVCAGEAGEPCHPVNQPCDASQGLECHPDSKTCQVGNVTVCNFEGEVHPIGHKFATSNCELMCHCMENGATVCSPMECRPGFVRSGTHDDDPFCTEISDDPENVCCSLVLCSSSSSSESNLDQTVSGTRDKFSVEEAPPSPSPSSSTSSSPSSQDGFIVIESTPQTGRILFPTSSSEPSLAPTTTMLKNSETDEPNTQTELVESSTKSEKSESPESAEPSLVRPPTSEGGNLEFLQITPTSIQVQFPGITGGNLMYVEERLFRGGKSSLHSETPWENAIILEGNKIFTLTGMTPGTRYRLRWQTPDRQYPDVMVSTHSYNAKQPKVIITGKTFDSVTLSFDHFAPDDYQYGYVAMYKERKEGSRWQSQEGMGTADLNGFDLPSITIRGLEPDKKYTARIAIYEDFSLRSFGKSTGTIDFVTDLGCMHDGLSYPVGIFTLGCEATCQCNRDGSVACSDRCEPPLHRSGAWANDPLCVEQFVDDDDCCVVITCAGNAEGENPEGPCSGITCGQNAECRHEVFRGEQAAETICVCKDGFTGDPDSSVGCSTANRLGSNPSSASPGQNGTQAGCLEKGNFFTVGEEWADGCEYMCSCSEKLEVVCQPRCKPLPAATEEKCELRPDAEDECCKVMYCPDPSAIGDQDLKPVALPFDGCEFKNESYNQGERFYDGCEQQCQCMGYGDMVCLSRCPPTAPAPGQNCYTLPDASDPCCNITVCDKPFLDPSQNVAKEDITIEEVLKDGSEIDSTPVPSLEDVVEETERSEELDTTTQGVNGPLKESRIVNAPEFAQPIPGLPFTGLHLGDFPNSGNNGISGKIFALNDTTLLLQDFTYDGNGPDVVFLAETDPSSPFPTGSTILPYPFHGQFFDYVDRNAPILGELSGSQPPIILPLPPKVTINQLQKLSVWSKALNQSLEDAIWSQDHVIISTSPSTPEDVQEDSLPSPDILPDSSEVVGPQPSPSSVCLFNNEAYELGTEFHDGCDAFCMCTANGEVVCHKIKCPSKFGLDVINPFCLEWDEHKDFVPLAPMCCPPVPVCKNDGSCLYEGQKFNNYDNIPANMTGCEDRCYCENSEVLCQKACYDLEPNPPNYLSCNPAIAIKIPQEERPCCLQWGCPDLADLPKKLDSVQTEPLNSTSLMFNVKVPRLLDGMMGFYEIFYTSGFNGHPDPNQWPKTIITPPNGKLVVSENEEANLILSELLPNQQYFLRVDVHIRKDDEPGEVIISSDVKSAKTLPVEVVEPETSIIPINVELAIKDITSGSAFVSWRIFSAEEKKSIDGVQIRFVILNGDGSPGSGVPGTSPFIHRDTNFFSLEDLKSDTEYEIDLYIIPIPKSKKEYISEKSQVFRTEKPELDPYQFTVHLNPGRVSGNSLELVWSGIPSPHQKYVNLYRILYAEDTGEPHHPHLNAVETQSVFKIAKIDANKSVVISNLKPETKYQVWLEAYLRNGKVFQSNVVDLKTTDVEDPKEMASPSRGSSSSPPGNSANSLEGDSYYNAMVVAAIVAAFALLALFVVTALYLKRTTTYKAIISGHGGKGHSSVATNDRPSKARRAQSMENGNSFEMNGVNGSSKKV